MDPAFISALPVLPHGIPARRSLSGRRTKTAATSSLNEASILTIDLGTSSAKAALISSATGHLLSPLYRSAYPLHTPHPFHATQRKDDWRSALFKSGKGALQHLSNKSSLLAISVTGQMQSLLAVPSECAPPLLSRDAILYCDSRAQSHSLHLSTLLQHDITPTDLLPKLALLPAPNAPYSLLLGAADYALYVLGGTLSTDPTNASTTGLTRPPHRTYNTTLLSKSKLRSHLPSLPPINQSLQICGKLSSAAATNLGLPSLSGTPLIHAGGDAATTTLGANAPNYIYIGSSGWAARIEPANLPPPPPSAGLLLLAHPHEPDTALTLASLASAGAALQYVANTFLDGVSPSELTALATSAPIGAQGLTFIPYLGTRRSPRPHPRASAALLGVQRTTSRSCIARAAIEGVAFALRACVDALTTARGPCAHTNTPVVVCGGAAQSEPLLRAITGALGSPVRRGACDDVALRGAARAALLALRADCMWGGAQAGAVYDEVERADEWEDTWKRWQSCVSAVENTWDN